MARWSLTLRVKKIDRRTAIAGFAALPLLGCDGRAENVNRKAYPQPKKPSEPVGLIELVRLDPSIRLDIRYATKNNFTGRQLYSQPRAFLTKPAAQALLNAHKAVQREGFGLTIYDAYRPWRVTKALWNATPPGPKRNYVANPKRGSKHNRGCAVDLTLHRLTDGAEVEMPSGYDEFTPRAHRNFAGAPPEALRHRALLERIMEAAGFRGASNEWWHFDFIGWQAYPLLDIPFEELERGSV
jgi:D-alanyl-D-alanine dipeptidase